MNVLDMEQFELRCTGCTACSQVCPTQAIFMQSSRDGFSYPVIDPEKCIHCGRCCKVCDPMHTRIADINFKGLYWAVNRDSKIRYKSSSGGFFYALAKDTLARDGVVFGAAAGADGRVVHRMVHTSGELERLMGSKYVQSDPGGSFTQIVRLLEAGREVFFSGTPCQVAGLKRFLQKEYENLITMDFICHGVPSPGVYRDMLESWGGHAVKDVTFREKKDGWAHQRMRFYDEKGKLIFSQDSRRAFYYLAFRFNYSLRKCCYVCRYPVCHAADITVGDHWRTRIRDDLGVSLVAVNTEQGSRRLERIKEQFSMGPVKFGEVKDCFTEHGKMPGYDLTKQEQFFSFYNSHGYHATEKKYMKSELKRYKSSLSKSILSRTRAWVKKEGRGG